MGIRGAPSLRTGAFRRSCRFSATLAAISAPKPETATASWTTSSRPVFRRGKHRVAIPWPERAQIDQLDRDALPASASAAAAQT
jgi:hypothetical protein